MRWIRSRRWNITSVCGGILGGLVSITAGCGNIHPMLTPVVGFIGGIVYIAAAEVPRSGHISYKPFGLRITRSLFSSF